MSPISLTRFFRKDSGEFVKNFLAAAEEPVAVFDLDGKRLAGVVPDPEAIGASDATVRVPVLHGGGVAGWVIGRSGSRWPAQVCTLINHLLREEDAKHALAAEALDKYRELHLLYRLSERLIASPQPEVIGQVALKEVCSVVGIERGMVVLTHNDPEKPQTIASNGIHELKPEAFRADRLVGRVIATGNAEIANHLPAHEYFTGLDDDEHVAIVCAPLKAEDRVFGVFLLVGGPDQTFSAGDLKLLNAIALQTAPAIEIAHLHRMELENAWLERDLEMARRVQTGLLPGQMPVLPGWDVAAFWRPARIVSGDLYDFVLFPDGKLGLVVADVTDKGVPAALLMANARSVLRGVAAGAGRSGWDSPSRLLNQVNDVLAAEMPMDMFVTCLLVVLDPRNGHIRFANAGHNPPYLRTAQGVVELRATGLPLGLFSDLDYEEKEAFLEIGDSLLMYSDGLVEAHDPEREMYGFPRLRATLADLPADKPVQGDPLIQLLIEKLEDFTRPGWEQEDDITIVALTRMC